MFAAAKRELDGQLVLTRWKKKKMKDRREGEWWPGTIKVHEGQMLVITRPNGCKRPHALNDTYHTLPEPPKALKLRYASLTLYSFIYIILIYP